MESKKSIVPYTPKEKAILFDLIRKYKDIVENKKTDSVSNYNKKETWKKITAEYNACDVSRRDELQLKRCWDKSKTVVRRQRQEEKCRIIKTGGGPELPPKTNEEELETQVLSIQPHLGTEIAAPWDSNHVYLEMNSTHAGASPQESEDEPVYTYILENMSTQQITPTTSDSDLPHARPSSPSNCTFGDDGDGHNHMQKTPNSTWKRQTESRTGKVSLRKSTYMVQAEVRERLKNYQEERRLMCEAHEAKMRHEEELHAIRMEKEKELLKIARIERRLKEKDLAEREGK